MATNMGAPLSKGRTTAEQENVEENWSEINQLDCGENAQDNMTLMWNAEGS